MAQFSSGRHEKLSADTHPWLHTHLNENCRDTGGRFRFNNGIGNEYRPRAEFDRPLTNPVNPILQAARFAPGEPIWYAHLVEWPTPAQTAHAHAVLARRAAIFGTAS